MPKHVENALSAKRVEKERSPGRYADGGGLYLVVAESGARWWQFRYKAKGSDARPEIGLGPVRDVSLADARDKARELRAAIREGRDPKAERERQKGIPTFEKAARELYESLKPGWREGGVHVNHWIASLETHVFPKIGDRQIDTITSADVLDVLGPIWFTVSETARRVRQRMRHVFRYAKAKHWYPGENPVDVASGSLPRHSNGAKRHLAAMPHQDLPDFMAELAKRDGVAALALHFLILTAARSGEVRGARWSEIDLKNATWTVPADRMKAKKAHRVPLAAEALVVLEEARGLDDDLVFPGQREGRPLSDMTLSAVLKRMKLGHLTVHGFRSTFRDWAAEKTTFPREIAELCLAHEVGDQVERAYRRSDLFAKRRKLMEAWARYCHSVEKKGAVVELRA